MRDVPRERLACGPRPWSRAPHSKSLLHKFSARPDALDEVHGWPPLPLPVVVLGGELVGAGALVRRVALRARPRHHRCLLRIVRGVALGLGVGARTRIRIAAPASARDFREGSALVEEVHAAIIEVVARSDDLELASLERIHQQRFLRPQPLDRAAHILAHGVVEKVA
jgi:hypothetical protein